MTDKPVDDPGARDEDAFWEYCARLRGTNGKRYVPESWQLDFVRDAFHHPTPVAEADPHAR